MPTVTPAARSASIAPWIVSALSAVLEDQNWPAEKFGPLRCSTSCVPSTSSHHKEEAHPGPRRAAGVRRSRRRSRSCATQAGCAPDASAAQTPAGPLASSIAAPADWSGEVANRYRLWGAPPTPQRCGPGGLGGEDGDCPRSSSHPAVSITEKDDWLGNVGDAAEEPGDAHW